MIDSGLFVFEDTPLTDALSKLKTGDTMDAATLLALSEGEEEETLEQAFQTLEDLSVSLDLSGLPPAPGVGEAAARLRMEKQLASRVDMISGLSPEDPLRLYLQEVAELSSQAGEPEALLPELERANGEENPRDPVCGAVAGACLGRVVELAREYVGRGVLLLDLIQEGSMGLWQGILAWVGGEHFADHRDWWIRQYMARAVVRQARENGLGQHLRRRMEDYRSVDERLLEELGRNPTPEEIAGQMHIPAAEEENVRRMVELARTMGKLRKASEPAPADEEQDQAVEDTAYFRMRQRIADLLSCVDDQDAKILTLRFGLEDGKVRTPEQTAAMLGLTPEQVTAREAEALGKLRQMQ